VFFLLFRCSGAAKAEACLSSVTLPLRQRQKFQEY
jgi:hypothetical protein